MTLPKKNRRKIVVADEEYFYIVSFRKSDRAVVQLADGTGAFLFVLPFAILRPKNLAAIIQSATARGWNTKNKQENQWVVFNENQNGQTCLEWLADDDFSVVTYNTRGILAADGSRELEASADSSTMESL